MKIDVKKLKKELTTNHIIEIVESLEGFLYENKGGNEIIFYSCCHHLNPATHKPKLYFYKNSQNFKCYTCSSSFDIIGLIEQRWKLEKKHFSFIDILNYIIEITNVSVENVQRISTLQTNQMPWEPVLEKYATFEGGEKEVKIYDKQLLNFFSERFPVEWVDQGISIDTMKLYGIKYYRPEHQTVIPCFDAENNLVGLRVRNWQPTTDRKYDVLRMLDQYPYSVPINQVLYGYNFNQYTIQRRKIVIIVESEKAVLKSDTWFGNESVAVGTFGLSGWNLNAKRQQMIFDLGVDTVIIIPDYGYKQTMTQEYFDWCDHQIILAKKFMNRSNVEIVLNHNNIVPYKDNAFDMDKVTYDILFKERKKMKQFIEDTNQEREKFNKGDMF